MKYTYIKIWIGIIWGLLGSSVVGCNPPPPIIRVPESIPPTETPISQVLTDIPTAASGFSGKVCQIESGWDKNSIFLNQVEFRTLRLPIGTNVTVTVRDTGRSTDNVTLSLTHRAEVCSMRLSKSLRVKLGLDSDTTIEPSEDRPNHQFDIVSMSSPSTLESFTFEGRVCMIKAGQDSSTVFLREGEYDNFGVPAGTTVNITATDNGKTAENVTLGVDNGISICVVRMPQSLREDLGLASDTDIDPPSDRPSRLLSIRVPQP